MKILYFIIGLSFLIFFHEFGHFLAAKLFGVYVYEFSLFMGPKLFQFKIGETKYTLRLLPIGGYCSMAGENDTQSEQNKKEEQKEADKKQEELPEVPFERTMQGIVWWKKILIMLAGPVFNIVLSLVLTYMYAQFTPSSHEMTINTTAFGETNINETVDINYIDVIYSDAYGNFIAGAMNNDVYHYYNVAKVYEGSYNYLADYVKNNKVYQVTTEFVGYEVGEYLTFETYDSLTEEIKANVTEKDAPTTVYQLIRLNRTSEGYEYVLERPITYTLNEDNTITEYDSLENLGIVSNNKLLHFGEALGYTFKIEGKMTIEIYKALGKLFTKDGLEQVSGVIGMYEISTSFIDDGFMYFMYFLAMISINLGIMNLLPFPALDGGQIVLNLVAVATKKKVSPKLESILNIVGFVILMGLILVITISDVFKYLI